MAYTIPTGGIVETIWAGTLFSQRTMTVIHWRLVTGSVSDGAATIALMLATLKSGTFGTAYLNCVADQYTGDYVQGQYISPVRYRPLTAAWGLGGTGGTTTTGNVSAAITRYGETASRHSVGTLHMPGVPTAYQSAGSLTAGAISAYSSFSALVTATSGLGTVVTWQPILLSRANPSASVTIIGGTVQTTVRTERRRTVGRGI